jgi:hypothetical protein
MEPAPPAPAPAASPFALDAAVFAGAAALVAVGFAAPEGLWAFPVRAIPAWAFPAGLTAALALATAWARFGPDDRPAVRLEPSAGRRAVTIGLALLLGFALLWSLRCVKAYGDAGAIAGFIDRGVIFHKREPLSPALFLGVHEAVGRAVGWPPAHTIRVVNTVAGAIGLVVIAGLVRRLVPDARGARLAATLALAGGGAVQLFAGYVENYTVPAVLMLASLSAGLDALAGRGGALRAYGLWTLSSMFHLSGLLFGPAMVWLAWHTTLGRDPRRLASRAIIGPLLVTLVPALALYATMLSVGFLRAEEKGFGGGDGLMFVPLFDKTGMSQYLFARPAHLLAVTNQQLLVAPLGLLVCALGLAAALPARRRAALVAPLGGPPPPTAVALVYVLLVAGAFWTLTVIWNPDLGALRDWDLFGPLGFYLNAAAVSLVAAHLAPAPRRMTAALVVLAAANLSRGLPFVLHNAGW